MARIVPQLTATQLDETLQMQPLQAAEAAASYPSTGAVLIAALRGDFRGSRGAIALATTGGAL